MWRWNFLENERMMLRQYQEDICRRVLDALKRRRSVMVQMPAGTGKTLVLAALVERLLARKGTAATAVVVAHRQQLVRQIDEVIHRVSGGVDGERTACLDRVEVRSIQWLNLHREAAGMEPALVIIDEAHHALADTYRGLWERWPQACFIGLTATPWRMNGEGFTDLFEVMVASYSIRSFMAEGWLAGYDYYSIRPDSREQLLVDSLAGRGADGDFLTREMREKLDGVPTLQRLYDSCRRFAGDRKGLVYAIDIEHAEHIAAFFRERGLEAAALSARSPEGLRRELLGRLREGSLQVLVNVDLFSEGFDCPDIGFIQLARPTLSLAKFLQMVGRGLRRHADKERCVILDNVGLYRIFGLPSADRDWGYFFAGKGRKGRKGMRQTASGVERCGLIPACLLEGTDELMVCIASYEAGRHDCLKGVSAGFEKVKTDRGTGWMDPYSGVVFRSYPRMVDVGGIQLATEDDVNFYPRIGSPWLNRQTAVNRKVLESQPFRGICWQRLYVPFDRPDEVFRLLEVKPNQVRLYEDAAGRRYVQEDLDSRLVALKDIGDLEGFLRRCDEVAERDAEARRRKYLRKVMIPGSVLTGEGFPEGAVLTPLDGELCRVDYVDDGRPAVFWVDLLTGYKHLQQPVLFSRGLVSLLREGDRVYVRNIRAEAGVPYRNWEVRCDGRLCTVADSLYVAGELDRVPYRIRKRSEDFRMFVVEVPGWQADLSKVGRGLMFINQPDRPLEVRECQL